MNDIQTRGRDYETVIRRNQAALDVHKGQVFRINGRKYTVVEIYPHIIRLQGIGGEIITMNKGDLVVCRSSGLKSSNDLRGTGGRPVVCLTDGKRYSSITELAKEIGVNRMRLRYYIDRSYLVKGKLYRWSEEIKV